MNQEKLDLHIEESLADRLADEAMKQLSEDDIKEATAKCINSFINWKKTHNWKDDYDAKKFESRVLIHFYDKVGVVIDKLLTEDDEFTKNIEDEAREIIRMSREAAEKYLVEAMAQRMCVQSTDFNRSENKSDIFKIVNDIIHQHKVYDHNKR